MNNKQTSPCYFIPCSKKCFFWVINLVLCFEEGNVTLKQCQCSLSIPISVANQLEKLEKDFLWGGSGEEFKFHLVDWDIVCTANSWRGLGVRKLAIFYQSLLRKLSGRSCGRDKWWRKVVQARHGECRGEWSSLESLLPHGRGLWKGIRGGRGEFSIPISMKVGAGRRVNFWEHFGMEMSCCEMLTRQ